MMRPTMVVNVNRQGHRHIIEHAKFDNRYVLIDRTTVWGNPFSHLTGMTKAQFRVTTRDEAIARYEPWLLANPQLVELLPTLRGKVLGCHCVPLKRCHGLVLARLADACA